MRNQCNRPGRPRCPRRAKIDCRGALRTWGRGKNRNSTFHAVLPRVLLVPLQILLPHRRSDTLQRDLEVPHAHDVGKELALGDILPRHLDGLRVPWAAGCPEALLDAVLAELHYLLERLRAHVPPKRHHRGLSHQDLEVRAAEAIGPPRELLKVLLGQLGGRVLEMDPEHRDSRLGLGQRDVDAALEAPPDGRVHVPRSVRGTQD
mmetsp:Transcript_78412/g.199362  ORF Transcript_78412/g.199362 Transcript_78412/m.199362 type:complete len:205 (+) Transcript_78412:30-644(+)